MNLLSDHRNGMAEARFGMIIQNQIQMELTDLIKKNGVDITLEKIYRTTAA